MQMYSSASASWAQQAPIEALYSGSGGGGSGAWPPGATQPRAASPATLTWATRGSPGANPASGGRAGAKPQSPLTPPHLASLARAGASATTKGGAGGSRPGSSTMDWGSNAASGGYEYAGRAGSSGGGGGGGVLSGWAPGSGKPTPRDGGAAVSSGGGGIDAAGVSTQMAQSIDRLKRLSSARMRRRSSVAAEGDDDGLDLTEGVAPTGRQVFLPGACTAPATAASQPRQRQQQLARPAWDSGDEVDGYGNAQAAPAAPSSRALAVPAQQQQRAQQRAAPQQQRQQQRERPAWNDGDEAEGFGSAQAAPTRSSSRAPPAAAAAPPQRQQTQQRAAPPQQPLPPQRGSAGSGKSSSGGGGHVASAPLPPLAVNLPPEAFATGDEAGPRVACTSCGRCFLPAALEKHARICATVFASKRKAFNMKEQRLEGSEAAKFVQKADGGGGAGGRGGRRSTGGKAPAGAATERRMSAAGGAGGLPGGKSKWAKQSEQLRAAMRSSKPASDGSGFGGGGGFGGAAPEEEDDR